MKSSRKKKHEEHENHERWLVSYADFITLLFAFFVIMYATSNNDVEKQKKFEESVRVNLSLGGPSKPGEAVSLAELVPELANPLNPNVQQSSFPKQGGPREVQDYVNRNLDKSMTPAEKEKMISSVRHDLVGVRIALAASSFFPTASAKLKYSSLKYLDQVGGLLKQTDKKVIVEGHTDDLPLVNSTMESNWELASLRATTVVRYLIKYHGIEASRLAAISYADQKPLVPNSNDENRAKNRRVELLIVTGDSEL